MPKLVTTCEALAGGTTAVAGIGKRYRLVFSGTWVPNDTWTLIFTLIANGLQFQIGAGRVTNIKPTFCFTYKRKIYLLAGSSTFFCQIDTPTVWNDPDAIGAGSIVMTNNFASPENLVAIAPYQGKLAFFSDKNIQIWHIEADPANNAQEQLIPEIGTIAKLSVRSLGELDVLFLSSSGVRSLRVRDTSLNAYVNDLGSPIDSLVKAVLSDASAKNACAIVDRDGRYLLFLKDTIYCLSYYPTSKIIGWSTRLPTPYVIQKFLVGDFGTGGTPNPAGDKLVARTSAYVIEEATSPSVTVIGMWVDAKKPATQKQFTGVDVVLSGSWVISVTADIESETFTEIANTASATFQGGRIAFSAIGTHLKWKAVSSSVNATLSSFIVHYEELDAS